MITMENDRKVLINERTYLDTLKIRGNDWKIFASSDTFDPNLEEANGFCDYSTRRIILESSLIIAKNTERPYMMYMEVMKHELIHAYIFESFGLSMCLGSITSDEVIVEFLANHWAEMSNLIEDGLKLLRHVCDNRKVFNVR